jgi:hypothetical protein
MSTSLTAPPKQEAADPAAVTRELQIQNSVLQEEIIQQKTATTDVTLLILQFKRQLQEAALAVDRKAESQQSRAEFLSRTLNNAEREKEKLSTKLRQLRHEIDAQREKFEQQLETMVYQAHESEISYAQKIQQTLQQLKNLRDFQEYKVKLDARIRELGIIMAQEQKEHKAELGAIHRKLVAQRQYYENHLAAKLSDADEYATKFEDLDLEKAMTKILQETEHRREQLKSDNSSTTEVIKRNDQLRHQVQDLEQQRHILEESEKNLTMQAVDLKTKFAETTKKSQEATEVSNVRLEQLKHQMENRVEELRSHLSDEQKKTLNLRRELSLTEKLLEKAEAQRDDRLKKDNNLLGVMTEAAIFVLTSLELQEKDPSKDEIASHSSALNAVIRKIAIISQDLTGVQQNASAETTANAAVQTELPVRKFVNSGKAEPKPKPYGTTKQVEDFRKNSEYQRVFAKEPGNGASVTGKPKVMRIGREKK